MAQSPDSHRSARAFTAKDVALPMAASTAYMALTALLLFLFVGDRTADAQGVLAPDQTASGRFSLAPVEGGVLRLDRETGDMTLCTSRDSKLNCEPVNAAKPPAVVPRSSTGDDGALAALRRENDELRARIRSLEDMVEAAPNVDGGPPPPAPIDPSLQVPSEEDIDRALDTVERVLKKFRERIRRFNEPLPDASPAPGDGPGAPPGKQL